MRSVVSVAPLRYADVVAVVFVFFLGCPQWERQQLIDRVVRAQQASLQPGTMGWTFHCRFGGLLQQHAKTIADHFSKVPPCVLLGI